MIFFGRHLDIGTRHLAAIAIAAPLLAFANPAFAIDRLPVLEVDSGGWDITCDIDADDVACSIALTTQEMCANDICQSSFEVYEDECMSYVDTIAAGWDLVDYPDTGSLAYSSGDYMCGYYCLESQWSEGSGFVCLDRIDVSFDLETAFSDCGDGYVLGTNECDDGNSTTGDGCSDVCAVESGWTCDGEPSVCAEDAPPAAEGDVEATVHKTIVAVAPFLCLGVFVAACWGWPLKRRK